jgi:hypothetical protein
MDGCGGSGEAAPLSQPSRVAAPLPPGLHSRSPIRDHGAEAGSRGEAGGQHAVVEPPSQVGLRPGQGACGGGGDGAGPVVCSRVLWKSSAKVVFRIALRIVGQKTVVGDGTHRPRTLTFAIPHPKCPLSRMWCSRSRCSRSSRSSTPTRRSSSGATGAQGTWVRSLLSACNLIGHGPPRRRAPRCFAPVSGNGRPG